MRDAPAPEMIGKVVALIHTPRGQEERVCVGRLAAYIRVGDVIRVWFEHSERVITEISVTQDKFSIQSFM